VVTRLLRERRLGEGQGIRGGLERKVSFSFAGWCVRWGVEKKKTALQGLGRLLGVGN